MYNVFNVTEAELRVMALGELRYLVDKAFKEGRQQGFRAGFAAAQQQPAAKIEAAYEQGVADATKLVPVRKNGVGY